MLDPCGTLIVLLVALAYIALRKSREPKTTLHWGKPLERTQDGERVVRENRRGTPF